MASSASSLSSSEWLCPECKRATEVVLDHSAGDTVCSECGLVLEAHSIDETSEWRTFANESGDNDPVRVGGPSNPLLSDGGLSTVISSRPNNANGGSDFLGSGLGRWQSRGSNPDRSLLQAFKAIASMSDRFVSFGSRFFMLFFVCLPRKKVWEVLLGLLLFLFLFLLVFIEFWSFYMQVLAVYSLYSLCVCLVSEKWEKL